MSSMVAAKTKVGDLTVAEKLSQRSIWASLRGRQGSHRDGKGRKGALVGIRGNSRRLRWVVRLL